MYETIEIRSMQEIRELFPNGVADSLNLLLLSTSGIHGSNKTIEDCEYILRGENKKESPLPNGKTTITVLVIQPRNVILRWGEIQVNMNDLDYLRKLVRSSIKAIQEGQGGNV